MRRHPALVISAAVYVVGFTIYGVATHSSVAIPYAVIVVGLGLVLARLDGRVHFSRLVLLAMWWWGLAHMAGGIIGLDGDRVLYNAQVLPFVRYDNIVHFVGFGAAGLATWEACANWLRPEKGHPMGTVLVVALLGMGWGAVNEVIEFAATHVLADTNVGGYENTGRDLVANLLGGLVGGVIASRRRPTVAG